VAILSAILRRSLVLNYISLIVWCVYNYSSYSADLNKFSFVEDASLEIPFDYQQFRFLDFPIGTEVIEPARYSLMQAQGKVAFVKLQIKDKGIVTVAVLELEDLFSTKGWEENKILLRRLAVILRHEPNRVVVLLRAKGPYLLSLMKAFAFQSRLETLQSDNPFKHIFGLGGWLRLESQTL